MSTSNRNVRKRRRNVRAEAVEHQRITEPVRGNDASQSELARILEDRGSVYGDFTENARISQALKTVMRESPGWNKLSDVHKEAMDQFALKQSRILTKNPDYADNWLDISGYATITAARSKNA